jgi:small subunit ribosomal protein S19e
MSKVLEVDPNELIERTAKELVKESSVKAPDWATFVKTGQHKQRLPQRDDWWQIRAAALLRSVAKQGPIGTQKLRTKYGGKKNRGHKTEHAYKGSGSITRKILQQLQKADLVREGVTGTHKGRVITKKAAALLNKISTDIAGTPAKTKKDSSKKNE